MATTSPAPAASTPNEAAELVDALLAKLNRAVPDLRSQAKIALDKCEAAEAKLSEVKAELETARTADARCKAAEAALKEQQKETEAERKEKKAAQAETAIERENAAVFRKQVRAAQKEVGIERGKVEAAKKEAGVERNRAAIACLEAEAARKDVDTSRAELAKDVAARKDTSAAFEKICAGKDAAVAALKEAVITKDLALKEARDGREKTAAALNNVTALRQELANARDKATQALQDVASARNEATEARIKASQALKESVSAQKEASDARDQASKAISETEAAQREMGNVQNATEAACRKAESAKHGATSALEDNASLRTRLSDIEAKSRKDLQQRDQTIQDISKQLETSERAWKGTLRRRDQTIKDMQQRVDQMGNRQVDKGTQCEQIDPPDIDALPIWKPSSIIVSPHSGATVKSSVEPSYLKLQSTFQDKPMWDVLESEPNHINAEVRSLIDSMRPSQDVLEHVRPHDWILSTVDKYTCVRDAEDTLEDGTVIDPMAGCHEEVPSPQAMCDVSDAIQSIEWGSPSSRSRPRTQRSEHTNQDDFEMRRDSITSHQASSSRHPVCVHCWQNGHWCFLSDSDDLRCRPCSQGGFKCVFKWCNRGDQCQSNRCVYFHNKDLKRMFKPEIVEDGDMGRRGGGYAQHGTHESHRGRKRRRTQSPPIFVDTAVIAEPVWDDGWRRKCICVHCWETSSYCHAHVSGTCLGCRDAGVECVRVRCGKGLACRAKKCPELHPGQVAELGKEGRMKDGRMKTSDDRARRRFYSPRRDIRPIPVDGEFREARLRLARGEAGADDADIRIATATAHVDCAALGGGRDLGSAVDPRIRPERSLSSRAKRRREMM
jgi:hypothetical protein